MRFSQKKIKLPHSNRELAQWTINKSEFEHVQGNIKNNYTWLRKAYFIYPMSEDQAIYSHYVKIDTSGAILKEVKIDFETTYNNFLGIDTEVSEELNLMPTIVLKGIKTGPVLDIYTKNLNNQFLLRKELHFYDIKKHLPEGYNYYDYREITYNHYRNVDHFKAIVNDNFNDNFVLIDQVPSGTYFFHLSRNFELKKVDFAKEFSGISSGMSQYGIGITSGFSTLYKKDSFYPRKTALDFIMNFKRENPRNYYYTVMNRKYYQIVIVEDINKSETKAYKLGK